MQEILSPLKSRSQAALANLTNTCLSGEEKSPSESPLRSKQLNVQFEDTRSSPSFQKENQGKSMGLEQENLQLKQQVELLKAALLGLCQSNQVELPGIMPLLL